MDLNSEINLKLIYGTETGFTKAIGEDIITHFKPKTHSLIKVDEAGPEDWRADLLILGTPTWCDPRLDTYGEYSDDWNESYERFSKIDFTNQTVALYGLGDQVGYGDNFVDGLGMLAEVVLKNGGRLIGLTSTEGYKFEKSTGLKDENTFYGLPIDEDNEPTHSPLRIMAWVKQLKEEI